MLKLIFLLILLTVPAYATSDIYSGLLDWYTLDSNNVSGATVTDLSGGGNTGTLVGSPPAITGILGQSIHFNGSSQYMTTTQMAGASSLTSGTLSAWVYSLATQPTYAGVMESRVSLLIAMGIGNFSGANVVWASWSGNALEYDANSGYVLPNNKWVLLTATFTSAGDKIYANGALKLNNTSITNSSQNANGIWDFGTDSTSIATRTLNGYLDDIRIYNRALSAAEIQMLYYQGLSQHHNLTP